MSPSPDEQPVLERVRGILCDLLLLAPEEVRPDSTLVGDLDLDSLGFIELVFSIEEQFGVEVPDVKASQEIFTMLLPDALQRLESTPGGTTFFEYVKEEAIRRALSPDRTAQALASQLSVPLPGHLDGETPLAALRLEDLARLGLPLRETAPGARTPLEALADRGLDEEVRERLFRSQDVEMIARATGARVPEGLDANAPLSALSLNDLFRFLTVSTMAGYVDYLLKTQQGTRA
jgi:acyl carrier protein